jgi:hypothetical protein
MSNLEKEYELEMEDVEQPSEREAADDFEKEYELEMEDVEQPSEREAADATAVDDLAQRFFELSQRQFESENEVDSAVNGLLNEVERQFFFKRLLKKKGLFGKLAKFGGKFVAGLPAFQGIKAVTQLARGDLKGALGALAKSGLASAIPGGSAVLPALKSLGVFETTEDSESDIDSWRNYVQVTKEAYEQLADNLNEQSVRNPVAASRQATQAFQSAVSKYRMTIPSAGMRYPRRKAYRFRVRSGDDFTIRIKGY